MSIIQFKEANCKNCYKCIRSCPVKAIEFVHEQAQIIEEDCMLCGNCISTCPQNAKSVKSDIKKVKDFIENGDRVYVSLAPSFVTAFDNIREREMFSVLKSLGFAYIEETAFGAVQVSRQYGRLLKEKKMKNIITTACPSIVYLVQKYYPELVDVLAPVVSPMIAHAKMLRSSYGSDIRVVFIGPCLSKKEECSDFQNSGIVDAVITFEELGKWLEREGINGMKNFSQGESEDSSARIYPTPGGILKTISEDERNNYKCTSIDGVDRCIKVLDSMKNGELENYFIEMNSCAEGCLGGPCKGQIKGGIVEAKERLMQYVKRSSSQQPIGDIKVDLKKKFYPFTRKIKVPDDNELQSILKKMGKFTKDMELNCGACGYASCREKAVAVYNNKAQIHMCLPYMRERAESVSNLIINNSPNAILALDNELIIQEANLSAKNMFNLDEESLRGKSIYEILDCINIEETREKNVNVFGQKFFYEKYALIVEQSIIFVPDKNVIIVMIKDITEEESKRQQMFKMRSDTIDIAQKVIEKQMRVAQEIASLLGETTAETKVALTKLKKSIMTEMGDI